MANFYKLLIVSIFLLTSSAHSSFWGKKSPCELNLTEQSATTQNPWIVPATPEIQFTLRKWQLERAQMWQREKFIPWRPGHKVKIANTEYEIIEFLGSGAEGRVYKAKNKYRNLFSIKQFESQNAALESKELLEKLRQFQIDCVKIFAEDEPAKSLVLEYIDGVNVAEILHAGNEIPEDFKNSLQLRSDQIYLKRREAGFYFSNDSNIIYEITTGRIVVIDPT